MPTKVANGSFYVFIIRSPVLFRTRLAVHLKSMQDPVPWAGRNCLFKIYRTSSSDKDDGDNDKGDKWGERN